MISKNKLNRLDEDKNAPKDKDKDNNKTKNKDKTKTEHKDMLDKINNKISIINEK